MLCYDTCIKYAQEKHFCPHCNIRLSCCETPPFHIGDGLGWGSDVMFICLNDECPVYVKGWEHIDLQYGHNGTYRYMLLPGEKKGDFLMVGSPDAFTGSIIDPEALKQQNVRYQNEKKALAQLETCVEEKNLEPVLALILDEKAGLEGRLRSCRILAEVNDLNCIDSIRNHEFKNTDVEQAVNMAIITLLKANFKKECPYCAEIIKQQAKICMHCNKELG
ncbi:MAG: zinc ribbon domain-containing protein [Desulfobulbaceae bacterium]|nr:zinc ribbon domain-containing protein [Desulfobulbaceae bacterium]